MQNSQAYIEFIKQINVVGREKMDGMTLKHWRIFMIGKGN